MADDYARTMRAQVEAMPRVRFVCGRNWMVGPNDYVVGFLWNRNFDAEPGEFVYRGRLLLNLTWKVRLRIERSF